MGVFLESEDEECDEFLVEDSVDHSALSYFNSLVFNFQGKEARYLAPGCVTELYEFYKFNNAGAVSATTPFS